jgi:formylglycine-generating enzyme required for sulfatase activity
MIKAPFAVGRFAVTFAEWDAAGLPDKPDDSGWGRGRQPLINVSREDAKAYVRWLSRRTGKEYRLPSEAEWEYCCRAGTTTAFWWGNSISTERANYNGNYTFGDGARGEFRQRTVPVDSFEPNPWGLYQTHGNIREWCADNWHDSYQGAPQDGSVWEGGKVGVLRGGSWDDVPYFLRSAYRSWARTEYRYNRIFGFRLARTPSTLFPTCDRPA